MWSPCGPSIDAFLLCCFPAIVIERVQMYTLPAFSPKLAESFLGRELHSYLIDQQLWYPIQRQDGRASCDATQSEIGGYKPDEYLVAMAESVLVGLKSKDSACDD
jgi:hypothetical protein